MPQPCTTAGYGRWFTYLDQVKWFEKYFAQCSVIQPRFIHEYDFEYDEGNLPPMRVLRELELMEFCYMKGEFYEDLVKVFYCNLRWDADNKILSSEVKGRQIVIDMREWSNITSLTVNGETLTGTDTDSLWGNEYSKAIAKDELLKPDFEDRKPLTSGSLKFEYRLLHYLITRCITPRAGNYFRIMDSDFLIMWAMVNRKPINWG